MDSASKNILQALRIYLQKEFKKLEDKATSLLKSHNKEYDHHSDHPGLAKEQHNHPELADKDHPHPELAKSKHDHPHKHPEYDNSVVEKKASKSLQEAINKKEIQIAGLEDKLNMLERNMPAELDIAALIEGLKPTHDWEFTVTLTSAERLHKVYAKRVEGE